MQDEVVFPAFGIEVAKFWTRCSELDDPQRAGFRKCYQLSTHADRVKHIAPSDYRPNTHLRMLLEQMVEEIADRIVEQRKSAIETGMVRAPKH
jgi:hypothetical protein